MSDFLGPIHTWLFRKIKLQNDLVNQIIVIAVKQGYAPDIRTELDKKFGVLETGELAEIVDESNIHGWLQERVNLVENRFAYSVTKIVEDHPERMDELKETATKFGEEHKLENVTYAREVFEAINNLLLDGMPCDRVNLMVEESDNEVIYEVTQPIHEPYWKMIGGNPRNYYTLKEAIINGMLKESPFQLVEIVEETYKICKK